MGFEREGEGVKGAYRSFRVDSRSFSCKGGHLGRCPCSAEFCPAGSACEGEPVVEALYEGGLLAEGSKTMSRVWRLGRKGGYSLVSFCLALRIS